jgi:hypothetical protein
MQGLSIEKVADCVKHDYLGTWKQGKTQYQFVIHVVTNRDDKPYVESLEWLEDEPDDVDDDEIIYYFAINHKYDI